MLAHALIVKRAPTQGCPYGIIYFQYSFINVDTFLFIQIYKIF